MMAGRTLKVTFVFLILLSSTGTVLSAKIYGKAYSWDTLEPVENVVVIVKVDGEVLQQVVSKDGSFSFEVSPGKYEIVAEQPEEGLIADENITVTSNISYRFDLILFPNLSNLNTTSQLPELPEVELEEEGNYVYIAITVSLLILISAYFVKRKERKERREERSGVKMEKESEELKTELKLPDDLKKVVEILRKEGGRMTQKELRKRIGCSEAKMSLMIADLERRGVVEKVRKGRGNVIFLNDAYLEGDK